MTKPLIKIALLLLVCLTASAGVIEYTDDDPRQYLIFTADDGLCDTTIIDSLQLWVQVNPNSGFAVMGDIVFTDTIHTTTFGYIRPDIDENHNLIPGHYVGEYWYYTIVFYTNGMGILSPDTVHQAVDYHVIGGCLPVHEVDDVD